MALITGGRVKIGYQAGLKLLRSGAYLIVTTRFPRDSAARYSREPDFAEWGHRLEIFGLDLRHTPSVEAFWHVLLATRERLDFIHDGIHMNSIDTGWATDEDPAAFPRRVSVAITRPSSRRTHSAKDFGDRGGCADDRGPELREPCGCRHNIQGQQQMGFSEGTIVGCARVPGDADGDAR